MSRSVVLALALIWSASGSMRADAGGPWRPWRPARPSCPTCPEHYCAKSLPLPLGPARCAGPDDYCPKPLPAVRRVDGSGCDDYCPKTFPRLTPCCPAWYTCPPREPSLGFEPVGR